MAYDTAGDPMGGLKWTHRTPEKLSAHLKSAGISVCPNTVARLLKSLDYALRVNHKKKSSTSNPHRDQQFDYIKNQRQSFEAAKCPIVRQQKEGIDRKFQKRRRCMVPGAHSGQ